MTYVRQFQLMYLECQKDSTWNHSNIFALTRLEWQTFSKWYINRQVNTLPIPNLHGMNKYVVDPVAAFDKLIKCDPKDFPTISDIKQLQRFKVLNLPLILRTFQALPIWLYLNNRMGMTIKYSWMLSRTLCSRQS
jgi:hypothetical protein